METKIGEICVKFLCNSFGSSGDCPDGESICQRYVCICGKPRDAGELYETAFGAWCGNWLVTVIAIVALAAFTARKDLKARIVSYGGILGMLASVFFGCVIVAAALYDGAYFKALGLAWFSCLVWFAVFDCYRQLRKVYPLRRCAGYRGYCSLSGIKTEAN